MCILIQRVINVDPHRFNLDLDLALYLNLGQIQIQEAYIFNRDPGCKNLINISFYLLKILLKDFCLLLYRLHTAMLNRPLSSAATMEVQGPDHSPDMYSDFV
jgi:hypothetical protein